MTIADFLRLAWDEPGDALIEPPPASPIVADPSFLFPHETPDGRWALVAHDAWGLRLYRSVDGLSWDRGRRIVRHAMRPFIRRLGGAYRLYFERYRPFALAMTALPMRPLWRSAVAGAASADLLGWGRAEELIAPELAWMRDARLGSAASNPCLAEDGDAWRLYFSASLAWIDDCGFCEPRAIGCASSEDPRGPFLVHPLPLIDPEARPELAPLGAGSMKAFKLGDGWLGLQNTIYRDGAGRSRSAIFILRSEDGYSWRKARDEPLLAPGTGWTASHVYACDCRRDESDGSWYLYFNARDAWAIGRGRERIGRIVGRPH